MTARGFYTLFFGVLMIITALSTGSQFAFMLGLTALSAAAVSLLCVLCACLTLRLEQSVDVQEIPRGDRCGYTLTVCMFSPLPPAPLSLRVSLPSGRQSEFQLRTRLFLPTVSENRFSCPHVGVHSVGVSLVRVSDCFSLFSFARRVRAPLSAVTVLPNPIKSEPLTFSPGEGEASAIQRAQADHTTPTDTRLWQDGDELKRVHWKLSMRRQQLMVHTYEQNQRPDALVLLDCGVPGVPEAKRAAGIDLLTQSCAGVLEALLGAGHAVRMPLSGDTTREISASAPEDLPRLLRELATQPFTAPPEFSRVLALSARRMHRTGSTAILTTRLTPRIADDVLALSRMGPHTYFYLISTEPAAKEEEKLLLLLSAGGVEARFLSAAAAK